jgi:hypothetical protein
MVILKRVLKFDVNGREIDVPINIHQPVDQEDCWQCDYEIDWPNASKRSKAYGVDSIQSLLLAMQIIGAELYASEAHRSGKLKWDRPGGGYGFPLHAGMRDLYEGDDRSM